MPEQTRKIFGAGMYRGMDIAAQIMNPRQYDEAERALTATARKVFECLPAAEPATLQDIYNLVRGSGISMRKDICLGCLRALCEAKLAKEVDGKYLRLAPRRPANEGATGPKVVRAKKFPPPHRRTRIYALQRHAPACQY